MLLALEIIVGMLLALAIIVGFGSITYLMLASIWTFTNENKYVKLFPFNLLWVHNRKARRVKLDEFDQNYCEHCGKRLYLMTERKHLHFDTQTGKPTSMFTEYLVCPKRDGYSWTQVHDKFKLESYIKVDGSKKKKRSAPEGVSEISDFEVDFRGTVDWWELDSTDYVRSMTSLVDNLTKARKE